MWPSRHLFQNDSQLPVADEGAGELEQAEVDVRAALIAGAQPFQFVQPGAAALDDRAESEPSGEL
jgi:hypothetical protein